MNIALTADAETLGAIFIIGIAIGAFAMLLFKRAKRIRWWPFIIALFLLGVALFLIPAQFDRLALFALVALTMAYAVFTFQQVEASKEMIAETKEQRLASLQPIVLLKGAQKSISLDTPNLLT